MLGHRRRDRASYIVLGEFMSMTTTNSDARFEQALPNGTWKLLTPSIRASDLTYENVETGECIRVPSIWYNQPLSWRVDAMNFYIERAKENAAKIEADKYHGWQYKLETTKRSIANLQKLVASLEKGVDPRVGVTAVVLIP